MVVEKTIEEIPLGMLAPAEVQPRSAQFDGDALVELAQSIVSVGLIQPVVVMPVVDEDGFTTAFELVAGERRARAMAAIALWMEFPEHEFEDYVRRLAAVGLRGLSEDEVAALKKRKATIPAIIRDPGERTTLQLATLAENIARESLSPLEEARAFRDMMERRRWSQRELAESLGVSQGYVSQHVALLALPPATQEAVSTRVITMAHAREIASLPEYAQEVAGEFVSKWAAAGETTRTIGERVKAVRNMLDPQRWMPNPAQFYEQNSRNYMKLIGAVAQRATAETARAVLAASEGKDIDVLTRGVKETTGYSFYASRALQALGITKTDFTYLAGLNGDSCGNCIFNNAILNQDDYQMGYCIRWGRPQYADTTWCENHIGTDEKAPIKLDYYTAPEIPDEKAITHGGQKYAPDFETYLAAYNAAVAKRANPSKKDDGSENTVSEIREYCDWVDSLPQATQWHFQAHACVKCVHYQLDNERAGLPHCRFAREMLKYGNGNFHAPRFAMLVSKKGLTVPRCEMFRCSEENITIAKPKNFRTILFGTGLQVALDWMQQMYGKDGNSHYATGDTICGCLNWLPYPHDDSGTDWQRLFTYIHIKGELLGGDQGRAVLIDSVMYEGRAMNSNSREAFPLLNVETGEVEEWMPAPFPLTKYFDKGSWPKGWTRPWEKEEEKLEVENV